MTQKTVLMGKSIKKIIFAVMLFSLVSRSPLVFAQDLPLVDAGSVNEDAILGMPVEEIILAANAGGLSANQDLAGLKPDSMQQDPEVPVSSNESPADPSPAVSSDSLKMLESQGGLSSAPQINSESPTVFNLAVKFFDKVVFKKDVEFANRPKFDKGLDISGTPTFNEDTAGFAIIKKGNQSVAIDFDQEYDSPPVITATLSLQQYKNPEVRVAAEDLLLVSDVKYIVTNVSKKGFEIMMGSQAFSDIPFSWHALAVNDPKTFKNSGGSSKSGTASGSDSSNTSAAVSPTGSGNNSNSSIGPGPAAVSQSETSSSPGNSSVNVSQNPSLDSSSAGSQTSN
jgi:hypothetical protein